MLEISENVLYKEIHWLIFTIKKNSLISRNDHGSQKMLPNPVLSFYCFEPFRKYTPYQIEVTQPCRKFARGLIDLFEKSPVEGLVEHLS